MFLHRFSMINRNFSKENVSKNIEIIFWSVCYLKKVLRAVKEGIFAQTVFCREKFYRGILYGINHKKFFKLTKHDPKKLKFSENVARCMTNVQ
jgi:hypothetical protein